MLSQDIVFAVRQFRHNLSFSTTVVLTLAFCIGATTAIFSLVDGILLHPLPFPKADRLLAVDTLEFPPGNPTTDPAAANGAPTSYPDYFDWREQNHTFESLASCDETSRLFSKEDGGGARVIRGARVSGNLFSTLGIAPLLGRDFHGDDELAGHRVIMLSHELWLSDFAASPNALGETVKISDQPYTVVGVMPKGFHFPIADPGLFWTTFAIEAEGKNPHISLRDSERASVIARLKPGVQKSEALADLNTIQQRLAKQYPEIGDWRGVAMAPLLEENVGEARSSLYLLLASVTALLLIGCANVAGLLLARANSRRSELALRAALGAARMRVLRQLMTEAVTLALAGGVLGILISFVLLRAGLSFVPHDLPRVYDVHINGRVMAFTVVLSVGTAFIFGLFPAWGMSHSDPAASLREMGAATTPGRHRHRFQHGLVIAETAIGFALLIASGLLIRSLVNVLHIEPGFDTAHTVFFDVALTQTRYLDVKKIAFFDRLFPQLKAIPGVERVGSAHPLPVHGGGSDFFTLLAIPGRSDSPDHLPSAVWTAATPGYFETLSIPLLRGRVFTAADDDAKAPLVALINRTFAQQFFPNIDPIGRYFTPRLDHEGELLAARQIVGIVGDTRTRDLWEPYQPQFFLPYAQNATHQRPMVVMRVAGDPKGYENTVRQIVATIDPQAPMFGFELYRRYCTKLGRFALRGYIGLGLRQHGVTSGGARIVRGTFIHRLGKNARTRHADGTGRLTKQRVAVGTAPGHDSRRLGAHLGRGDLVVREKADRTTRCSKLSRSTGKFFCSPGYCWPASPCSLRCCLRYAPPESIRCGRFERNRSFQRRFGGPGRDRTDDLFHAISHLRL